MTSAYPAGGNDKQMAIVNHATNSQSINTHRRSHRINIPQCTVCMISRWIAPHTNYQARVMAPMLMLLVYLQHA